MMVYAKFVRQYLFNVVMIVRNIFSYIPKLKRTPIFLVIGDNLLSAYYYYGCGLTPCTVDLDHETTMHFWISKYRRHHRPNLVLLHGCGGDARLQFYPQIRSLSKSFNIYMPDLLFFGKSYSKSKNRTPRYQAKCVMEGLKRGFGVERCSVYSISYGGWVGYSMAEMYPDVVERNVIVSTGVGTTTDQKMKQLSRAGKPAEEVVLPKDPDAARLLMKGSIHKYDLGAWTPDFMLWEFIQVMEDKNRKEKEELIQCLMSGEPDSKVSPLSQETLLVWGDHDNFFPADDLGVQLQRIFGDKARLTIIKETGHAVNIDAPKELNNLIKSFVFGRFDK